MKKARGHTAVMNSRSEPPDSLDFFPTPPWATRALIEHVMTPEARKRMLTKQTAWDPACGEGHMAEVLKEYFKEVWASDVWDYGHGYMVGSFIGLGADIARAPGKPDWVITNPPFNKAVEFWERAWTISQKGLALLCRSNWVESHDRYLSVFKECPPTTIAQFVERVPMVKGRWDPGASTATSYAWFVWDVKEFGTGTKFVWIPPGRRQVLEKDLDRARFGPKPEPMSLLREGAQG